VLDIFVPSDCLFDGLNRTLTFIPDFRTSFIEVSSLAACLTFFFDFLVFVKYTSKGKLAWQARFFFKSFDFDFISILSCMGRANYRVATTA